MTEFLEVLKVYKDFGAAGVFLGLYLLTLRYFYKELRERNTQTAMNTERVVVALDRASDAIESATRVSESVGKSLDVNTRQTAEFIAFVRGRDAGAGRSN